MSLRRGVRRRRGVVALTAVGALFAFQALAIVGATAAFAQGTCSYDLVTDTVEVDLDPGADSDLQVDGTTGAIEFDGSPCDTATNSNTVAIVVQGENGSVERFDINEETEDPFSTSIAWEIDLGTGDGDHLEINLNGDQDNNLVLTNTSFNLNGALGVLAGIEVFHIDGDDGDDVIDGSAATIEFDTLHGHGGDDVISPGSFIDDGDVDGNGGDDTLSYATRTSCTVVDNDVDAGLDANCDGDNDDAGDEEDDIDCFEVVITGSGNDTLDGDGDCVTVYAPGAGDDDISNENVADTLDLSSSTAGVVIDVPNQTATGQGTDTWENLTNFIGSAFDDTLLVDGDTPGPDVASFSGLGGTDTVDASGATSGVLIDLDPLDPDQDDLENVVGSPFNDSFFGNDLRNVLTGGDGDDNLDGEGANDTMIGGLGNDTYDGDEGADTASFKFSPAGVTVDLSLGFATGEGDDIFDETPEIIVGSNFNDSITGGPFSEGGTVNFLFKGRAGADVLTGFSGNDTLKGAGGKDTVRGGRGDDTLAGGGGNDTLSGAGGFDVGKGGKGKDVCKGVEQKTSCGSANNPA